MDDWDEVAEAGALRDASTRHLYHELLAIVEGDVTDERYIALVQAEADRRI